MKFIAILYTKIFFAHVSTDTTKQENLFEEKPMISETTIPIKQNVNVSRAETVNQATKCLKDFTKHLPHRSIDISWMDLQVT